MRPQVRKFALALHVLASVGWLGAVAAFLVLAVVGIAGDDDATVRASYIAMDLIAWAAIVPLAFASLLTGVIQSFVSPWGLVRHYWVLVKLLLTIIATVVLILQLGGIDGMSAIAERAPLERDDHRADRLSLLIHAAGGIAVLVTTTALAIFKPRGATGLGRRKPVRAA